MSNLPDFVKTNFVRVEIKLSGKGWDILGKSTDDYALLCQYPQQSNWDNQKFLLFPILDANDPAYIIIAKHSGKVLDVLGKTVEPEHEIGQYPYGGTDNQIFYFEPASESGYYFVRAKHSGLCFEVWGQLIKDEQPIIQYHQRDRDAQKFKFIKSDTLDIPDPPVFDKIPEGFIPTLETYDRITEYPQQFLVGRSLLSCIMVNDPNYDLLWRIKNSPYYILERRVRYVSKDSWFYANNTSRDAIHEYQKIEGWEQTQASSFSSTTSISLSAETGSPLFGATFTVGISQELGFESTESFTTISSESTKLTANIAPYHSWGMWTAQSEYTLKRMNGTVVSTWTQNGGFYTDDIEIPQQFRIPD